MGERFVQEGEDEDEDDWEAPTGAPCHIRNPIAMESPFATDSSSSATPASPPDVISPTSFWGAMENTFATDPSNAATTPALPTNGSSTASSLSYRWQSDLSDIQEEENDLIEGEGMRVIEKIVQRKKIRFPLATWT